MIVIALAAATLTAPRATSPAEESWRACVDRTTTNYDWGQCGKRYIEQADAELNRVWQRLAAASNGKTKTDLLAEQRTWLTYRKTACQFYANGDWGREGEVLHFPGCVAGMIEQRTRELSNYRAFVSPK